MDFMDNGEDSADDVESDDEYGSSVPLESDQSLAESNSEESSLFSRGFPFTMSPIPPSAGHSCSSEKAATGRCKASAGILRQKLKNAIASVQKLTRENQSLRMANTLATKRHQKERKAATKLKRHMHALKSKLHTTVKRLHAKRVVHSHAHSHHHAETARLHAKIKAMKKKLAHHRQHHAAQKHSYSRSHSHSHRLSKRFGSRLTFLDALVRECCLFCCVNHAASVTVARIGRPSMHWQKPPRNGNDTKQS